MAAAIGNCRSNGTAHAASSGHSITVDPAMKIYEGKLTEARVWARTIASLHALSQFLAYCNLTWATVAVLGGFLPKLLARDFAFATCLILVEAGRLALASFFMRLLKRPLAYASQDPKHIDHRRDDHYALSRRARLFSKILQLILITPGFILPFIGLKLLNYGSASDVHNLQRSLRIFYILVAINSLVALVYLLCSLLSFLALSKTSEQSILRYFDTVLESAMDSRLAEANDMEFFRFAYTMLGSEFSRNVQPEAVARNHTNMIRYMHTHRGGMEALEKYLDADDAFVRLAAANMVGFWADRTWGVGVSGSADDLRLPPEVLTKLADKVSTTGQVGWAATASFGVLALSPEGARIVARTCTSNGTPLPARLAELVHASSSRSLSLVRTLAGFYEQLCVHEQKPPEPFGEKAEAAKVMLVAKLEMLARGAKVQRLRVQAAYLLLLMRKGWKEEVVLGIEPGKDTYWFESEAMMLELLLKMSGHSADRLPLQLPTAADPQKPFLRKDAPISPPSWATDPTPGAPPLPI